MTEVAPQRLEPLTLPLFGERLIEASAGTGKTFTIGALYLRLLLGLGGEAAFPRPLTVEEILVVTFTEAATEELRGRIRDNIHGLRIACVRGISANPLFSALMEEIDDLSDAAAQLLAAERQMDEAAIYTIHGFCQRMLTHNAFESGMLFEQTLVQDELPLRRQACADFWRRHCYPLPLGVARAISQEWSGPEALLADLSGYLHGEAPALRRPPKDEETVLMRHEQIVARIDAIKAQWRAAAGDLEALIAQSGVDKRSYSSKHLPNWLNKVGEWSGQETQDYQLPKELDKFRQSVLLEKTKKGEPPRHALFTAIDELFDEPLTLRGLIMARALSEIRTSIQQEKRQRAELGFDDLLSRLDSALQSGGGEQLAQAIRQRYPVAMIDEFQDTDPQQYRIFQKLYVGRPDCGLLLIGDPKQAIYAFRGADIFTYMRARSEVSAHYTLETNWRSSPSMVASVNHLFSQVEKPFLFGQIPFIEVNAAEKNQGLAFELHGKPQPAMQFWLQQGEGAGVSDYQQLMARLCATQIRDWLSAGQQGLARLQSGKASRPVQASDITVLVRSRNEAALVRDALSALSIPSVYLSNRDSVFDTPEAKDLLWLLQAVLAPEQERTLRSAMATGLMGLDAPTLDGLSRDERAWDALVNEFDNYRTLWLRRGVLPMLSEVMKTRQLAENLLASAGGERRLTDVLHLGELLQEAAAQLDSEHALVRWLAQQIAQPNRQSDNQQLRLESDRHLVQVITIHKSKGLEFDLVWLPFVGNFRQQQQALYHDRHSFQALLDLDANEESQAWAEEERLAEDLRLLYVALTRSVYHCSIGIAPLFQGTRKKQGDTDLHRSALGYLVQGGQPGDAVYLQERLQQLVGGGIALSLVEPPDAEPWQPQASLAEALAAKSFTRRIQDFWRVTSYTGLQQHGASLMQDLLPRLDVDAAGERGEESEPALTPHTFPRGATPGTFLHSLFETLDFTQPLDEQWLLEQLQQQGFAEHWQPILLAWMQVLLNTPLDDSGVTLAALTPQHKQAELQFYLPINRLLQAKELDALVKRYDPLSARCPALDFHQVQGMLKGFIDLVFCWQGKYYLLDYKSNWLGEDSSAYTRPAMEQAMAEHRYDLQYQLYTLALHRYLRHRLPDYDYRRHFGGVIYLFLRGVDAAHPGNGIFTCLPAFELVAGMDSLFSGEAAATEEKIMIALLEQAVALGALRPLDVQFARVVASEDEPDILLAAACLSAEAGAGHVCLMLEQLQADTLFEGRQPALALALWEAAGRPDSARWQQRLASSAAVGDGSGATPLVLRGQRLYLQRMWQNEGEVAAFIGGEGESLTVPEEALRAILDRLFGAASDEPDWQKIAAAVAATRRIAVISGGPGTGKTTTVAKLLAALVQLDESARLRIQLAAPTGKAAARLTESLGSASRQLALTPAQQALFPTEAATLHRLLGAQPNSQRMRYHRGNRLHLDVLVVDEASMVDLPMMARLIAALPDRARVIFLGDRDQLASVEAGAVLGDICRFAEQGYSEARAAELSRLTGCSIAGQRADAQAAVRDSLCLLRKSYRFDARSGIGQLALAVNAGAGDRALAALNGRFGDVAGYALATSEEYQALLDACVAGYRDYLRLTAEGADAAAVLAAFSRFQVLCALREGPFGVAGLNERIELGLQRAGLIDRKPGVLGRWYRGRPVMIGRNDSALGLFNGDIGITLPDERGELRVHFQLPDGSIKSVQPSRLPAHETAYAMTVHKSQGSEFEHTVLVLPNHFLPVLTRELVYTAITRARQQLSLYATDAVLLRAIRTPTQRRSGLAERLQTME